MINSIIEALKAEKIDTWAITEKVSHSCELFFVRRNMDLKRRTSLTDYSVAVYRELERDGARLLGSSSVPIYPGMDAEAIRSSLREAYFAASVAGNQYYELIEGKKEPHVPSGSGFAVMSVEDAARTMGDALFKPDINEDVFVNSAEIFAIKRQSRVINSRGVDVSWDTCEVRGEFVCQCPAPQDVETYHSFAYTEPDAAALTLKVEEALSQTRDRAAATKPPKAGTYTVILSEDHLSELFSYYVSRSSAGAVYQHYSDYEAGKNVQGEDVTGDKLTIELAGSEPYDGEGIRLTERPLMEEGVVRTIHGGARFSGYLGLTPTGSFNAMRIPTGDTPVAELKAQPHLHVVTFSDFQMNAMSGHFAGEIRLAYLFDGEKTVPVTGGSINGSILEAQRTIKLSRERYVTSTYSGPLAVALQNVQVAGA